MIAGGIGITPMLSMLRYMADVDDPRQILLIRSNKTKEHVVFTCDPFEMMKEMSRGVKKAGFSSAGVYKEEFKL